MSNLTGHPSLDRGITEYEQILPICLNISSPNFDSSLHSRPGRLKEFVQKHMQDYTQEIFDLQKRHTPHTSLPYKKILLKYNSKYLYIYIFYGLNDHNNIRYLPIL